MVKIRVNSPASIMIIVFDFASRRAVTVRSVKLCDDCGSDRGQRRMMKEWKIREQEG